MKKHLIIRALLGLAFIISAGCDATSTQPEITGLSLPTAVNPDNFSKASKPQNPFFPLVVGTARRSVGQTPEGEEVSIEEVTDQTKVIQGVTAQVIRHRFWLNGELTEEALDWYALDNDGNVWYFGEDVKNFKNGQFDNNNGSWEAGVDGAMAGILMWATPKVGSIYYQEYYKGQAEDVGEVLSINETVSVPYGSFAGCLKIEDTTPLEPALREHKYFCPGIGQVLEENLVEGFKIELVEVTSN